MTNPSAVAVQSPPSAAIISAVVAMRSLSFTRSSSAPVITLSPSAKAHSSAMTGNSSMSEGIHSRPKETARSGDFFTRMSATGSPHTVRSFSSENCTFMALNTRKMPARVGLTPTFLHSVSPRSAPRAMK